MSNAVTTAPAEANKVDPNALIHHHCIIVYVDGLGFQVHPLDEKFTPEGPSILICNTPFQRTMNPVLLAPPEYWSASTVTMASEIRESGFCGEAYFSHSEHGLVMIASLAPPWRVHVSEGQQLAIKALPLLTDS